MVYLHLTAAGKWKLLQNHSKILQKNNTGCPVSSPQYSKLILTRDVKKINSYRL